MSIGLICLGSMVILVISFVITCGPRRGGPHWLVYPVSLFAVPMSWLIGILAAITGAIAKKPDQEIESWLLLFVVAVPWGIFLLGVILTWWEFPKELWCTVQGIMKAMEEKHARDQLLEHRRSLKDTSPEAWSIDFGLAMECQEFDSLLMSHLPCTVLSVDERSLTVSIRSNWSSFGSPRDEFAAVKEAVKKVEEGIQSLDSLEEGSKKEGIVGHYRAFAYRKLKSKLAKLIEPLQAILREKKKKVEECEERLAEERRRNPPPQQPPIWLEWQPPVGRGNHT